MSPSRRLVRNAWLNSLIHSFELGGDKKTKGAALTFVCPLALVDRQEMLTVVLTVNAELILHLESFYAVYVLSYYHKYAWTML